VGARAKPREREGASRPNDQALVNGCQTLVSGCQPLMPSFKNPLPIALFAALREQPAAFFALRASGSSREPADVYGTTTIGAFQNAAF
jgi:hypothetical protein